MPSYFRTRYVPELLSALALSSLSVHLFFHRRQAQSDRDRIAARTSILQDLAQRLRAGENIPDSEVARLRKLARQAEQEHTRADILDSGESAAVGWRDVVFGRRPTPAEDAQRDAFDAHDIDRLRRELEKDASPRA
ncbi:hypothetical protein K488DRAFT_87891 [Vararia minispora EC-137]|uniref:Uncharacterized protein n=1 Tax=Vararia minispora EC-137 TaxID=1314806 RepID=A0ACB8QFC6_9AGAM|nr:hypothetical protein K488DRAFT_87891 [Vararia minispora EC-137]